VCMEAAGKYIHFEDEFCCHFYARIHFKSITTVAYFVDDDDGFLHNCSGANLKLKRQLMINSQITKLFFNSEAIQPFVRFQHKCFSYF
jgi:hypothetical protein